MQGVPEATRDALVTAYRALPSVADDVRRYAQRALAVTRADEVAEPYAPSGCSPAIRPRGCRAPEVRAGRKMLALQSLRITGK